MKRLYAFLITLSAVLLFSIEPMVTRTLLPLLGGSSAVWITALAFFQLVLLLGYAYSVPVALASAQRPGRWRVHLLLLVLAFGSLFLPALHLGSGTQHPQLQLFLALSVTAGVPFFTLTSTAPLLQAWYARREQADVPYRLFGLSNLASLVALVAYPTLVEPFLGLHTQWLLWKAAFVLYVAVAAAITLRMRDASDAAVSAARVDAPEQTPRNTRLLWFTLPAVASLQLAAVTGHLTQDVASMPLLWVVPLAVYLLTFVLAFEWPALYKRSSVLSMLAVLLFALGYFLTLTTVNVPIGISIVFFSAELFFVGWFCHAELFAMRPADASASSSFYLHIAAGGAAGTLAVAVLSPLLTDSNFDLPASFLVTALLILVVTWHEGWQHRSLWGAGALCGVYLLVVVHAAYEQNALLRVRNFYGSLRVKQSQTPPQAYLSRSLYNGAIQHGMQWFSTEYHHTPLTYYTPGSGVGLALQSCCGDRPRRIGVIGLGAGTLAAYGHAGDDLRFYEINPAVIDVAQHLFTYTRDTPAHVAIVPGDARLSLAGEAPQRFDVLVVDAFSGDSIPTHLLTREALALYRRHLAPGGILAFHISNRYLDLAPVLARLVQSSQAQGGAPLTAREFKSGPDENRGEALAYWVLITDRPDWFQQPALALRAKPLQEQPNVRLWTDDYSSLLPILRWTGQRP